MIVTETVLGNVLAKVVNELNVSATFFVNSKLRVRATRKLYRGRIDRRSKGIDLVVSVGRPNYEERMYIRDVVKAGFSIGGETRIKTYKKKKKNRYTKRRELSLLKKGKKAR